MPTVKINSLKATSSLIQKGIIAPFAIAAVIAIAGASLSSCDQKSASAAPPQMPPAAVSVVTLHSQTVPVTAELSGRTSASVVAEVRPQIGGIIKARLFKEGADVKAGDVLYQIDPAPYQAAFDNAKAALAKAQASLPNVDAKFSRAKALSSQKALSTQDYENAELAFKQAEADVEAAEAQVDSANINLSFTKITAPISGRIGKSSLTEGALVTTGQTDALAVIRDLDTINVDVTRSSGELLDLQQKIASGKIEVDGGAAKVSLQLDDGSTYPHAGVLAFSEAVVDEGTGTYTLRATFPNPEHTLLPGMFVRAVVSEGVANQSFLVPERAVSRDPKGNATALFVKADGTVEQRTLQTVQNIGNSWLVYAGLADGDRLIVEGSMKAKPGAPVTATEVSVNEATGGLKANQTASK